MTAPRNEEATPEGVAHPGKPLQPQDTPAHEDYMRFVLGFWIDWYDRHESWFLRELRWARERGEAA